MAVTLEEFELKLKSEVAAAGSKDVAALQKVDAAVKAAQGSLAGLQAQAKAAVAARDAAAAKLGEAQQGFGGKVDINAVRRAQAALASAQAGVDAATGKASAGERGLDALKAARPKLEALALEKNQVIEAAKAQAQAVKKAERDKVAAQKEAAAKAAAAAKDIREQQDSATRASFAFKASVVQTAAEVSKYAAIALAAATAALIAFGVASASAARQQRILGLALTGNEALGKEFGAIVNQLAQDIPLAKDQIGALAQELSLLRLGRRDLQAGLTAIGIVTSALGDSAGSAVKAIVSASAATRRFNLGVRDIYGELTGLAGTGLKKADVLGALAKQFGVSVGEAERQLLLGRVKLADGLKALEAAAQGRFGKVIALQMLDFNVQIQKAKEAIVGLFADVDLEPFLAGMKDLLRVFDSNTVVGRALRTLLTDGFNGLGIAVSKLAPVLKQMFLGAVIGALQFYLAIRPVVRVIGEVVGWLGRLVGIENAVGAGKFLFIALAGSMAVFAAAVALAFAPLALLLGAIGLIGYGLYKIIVIGDQVWGWLNAQVAAAAAYIESIDLGEAAANMIRGLVNGITQNAGAVIAALGNLATQAIGSFKAQLGIASPSKVFEGFGTNIAMGAAIGVEQGTPAVEGATSSMGGAAVSGATAGASAASGGGGGPRQIVINLIMGGKNMRQIIIDTVLDEVDVAIDGAGAGEAPGIA